MRDKISEILQTDIYGITCEEMSGGRSNPQVVREMIGAGIKIIQYREKEKSKREKLAECRAIRKICNPGVLFIVNDDIDIAILCQADGVHVGQDDLPADEVRKLLGPEMIIGVSAGTPDEVDDAIKRGADYLGVGPVFTTGTKTDAGLPVGLDFLEYVVKNYYIPLVAIGGINCVNIKEVQKSGVPCSAMVSALVASPDIKETVAFIRHVL